MNLQHVLVPTDFEPAAKRARDLAIDIARPVGAKITILHAFLLPVTGYNEYVVWPFEEFERAARDALEAEVAEVRKSYPQVEGQLRVGAPWECIVKFAEEHAVDLIAMGTHGRRGLSRALIGSVADKIVRLSPCPVLTTAAVAEPKER
jgi:nucleotide-binding universal stress UspA family protein